MEKETANNIQYKFYYVEETANPICSYCGKYKAAQGNGIIHPLCECGNPVKQKEEEKK